MALSYLVASAGALVALLLTQRAALPASWLIGGGLSIGTGIWGLHYIDIVAMRMPASAYYEPATVLASYLVAFLFGVVSLWLGRRHREDDPRRPWWSLWLGGAVMGLAIVGQHYTGMASVRFSPGPDDRPREWWRAIPSDELPEAVLLSTLSILGLALGAASADRRRGARALVSQRLLAAQERERRRIARGLHEDIGQTLTALRLNLQRLSPAEQETPIVADSVALVDDALARVRALSVELRPSVLDDLGLTAAVEWYARRSAERAGYAVTVESALGASRLPEWIETAGFRIVREALTNIARHGRAPNVRIALERSARHVELTVADDGGGFDVAAATARAEAGESLGLLDMREAVTLAGGTLTLTSAPGRGTTIRVRFPAPRRAVPARLP